MRLRCIANSRGEVVCCCVQTASIQAEESGRLRCIANSRGEVVCRCLRTALIRRRSA